MSGGPPLWMGNVLRHDSMRQMILSQAGDERTRFLEELYGRMHDAPLVGFGCVVNQPGYDHRYRAQYGRDRWFL